MEWNTVNILTILGIIIPVILSIGIFVYQLRLERKGLSYVIFQQHHLAKRDENHKGLSFLYNNDLVEDLYLLRIKVFNSGRKHISEEDFVSPLKFYFEGKEKIVSITIDEKSPTNLDLRWEVGSEKNYIEFSPTLLNRKDGFTCSLLVSNSKDSRLNVMARIKDVVEVKSINEKSRYSRSLQYFFYLLLSIAVLVSAIIDLINNYDEIWETNYNQLLRGIVFAILIFGTLRDFRKSYTLKEVGYYE